MKCLRVHAFSEPQTYSLDEVEEERPGRGELKVAVHTVAISLGDTIVASGRYQVQPQLPFTPGSEFSGIVTEVGAGVETHTVGEKVAVFGFVGLSREGRRIVGACRESAVVPVRNVLRLPDAVDLEQAALLRSNNETAYYGLQQGALAPGETLLVLGAAGGTGYAAVSLGKIMGAVVIASASTEEKRRLAMEAGADHVIDSSAPNWRDLVKVVVGDKGVDVVFDPVGGDASERAFRTLGYGGRHVVIGFAAGTIGRLALNLPLLKASSLVGANMLVAWETEPERIERNLSEILKFYLDGKLKLPPITQRYPLAQAANAFAAVQTSRGGGRIIISVADEAPDGGTGSRLRM